jgi:hypothetical protein
VVESQAAARAEGDPGDRPYIPGPEDTYQMARARFIPTPFSLLTAVVVSLAGAGALGQETGNSGRLAQTKEEQLGSTPTGFTPVVLYQDGLKALYSSQKRAEPALRCDLLLEGGLRFDKSFLGEVRSSPDHRHMAFAVGTVESRFRQATWNVVYDGKALDFHADEIKSLTFSTDSSQLAFAVRRGAEWQICTPDKPGNPTYERVSAPVFGSGSLHLAYGASRSGQQLFILDGQTVFSADESHCAPSDSLDFFPAFSPDGKSWAIAVSNCKRGWSYRVNGKMEAASYMVLGPFVFSPDGQHTAYGAATFKSGFVAGRALGTVVVDGKESGHYEVQALGNAQGTVKIGPKKRLQPSFASVSSPEYSLDGRHLVYIGQLGLGRAMVVVDGQPGAEFAQIIDEPVLSPDGQHMGYLAMRNRELVQVLDGRVTGLGDLVPEKSFSFAGLARISPDGKHFGCVITKSGVLFTAGMERARRRLLLDGKLEKEYDCMEMSPPLFSSDGRHHACVVRGVKELDGKSLVVVDGFEGPLYDSIPPGVPPRLEGAAVTFVGLRDGVRYRVTEQAP